LLPQRKFLATNFIATLNQSNNYSKICFFQALCETNLSPLGFCSQLQSGCLTCVHFKHKLDRCRRREARARIACTRRYRECDTHDFQVLVHPHQVQWKRHVFHPEHACSLVFEYKKHSAACRQFASKHQAPRGLFRRPRHFDPPAIRIKAHPQRSICGDRGFCIRSDPKANAQQKKNEKKNNSELPMGILPLHPFEVRAKQTKTEVCYII